MATLDEEIEQIVLEVNRLASLESKLTGFCIGNTRKINDTGLYFSPLRRTSRLIAGSAIVYDVSQAVAVARAVDGMVDYVLVDTEKKISTELYGADNVGNVERAVRETVKHSRVLAYKGNDLTVDSIENLIVQILSTHPRGLSGKRAAIIGAGNVGSKLALKLVERGMDVSLIRRDRVKLAAIVTALNIIKPAETIAKVTAGEDNLSIAQGADLLVGLTQGIPVITIAMIDALAHGAVLLDGGKGCCEQEAIRRAQEKDIPVYRADIRPGFEGHMGMVLETERIVEYALGRTEFDAVPVVSGGLLARPNEVVVDSIADPHAVFGIANGLGDFVRVLDNNQAHRLQVVHDYILRKRGAKNVRNHTGIFERHSTSQ
ncbi:NAD(P)-binding domain-containing protein [Polynucleobacter necessarius]|uniref:NAD(P)-binding domain-containing protein n=1 Tax=Polynucleobacter necessarius TaxID=576610 RepID=UPI000E09D8F5|nr:NAD(P)-binding domain-containing protein [Polynucleobacter necessarius]